MNARLWHAVALMSGHQSCCMPKEGNSKLSIILIHYLFFLREDFEILFFLFFFFLMLSLLAGFKRLRSFWFPRMQYSEL